MAGFLAIKNIRTFESTPPASFREYASILSFTSRILDISFVALGFLLAYYLKFADLSLTPHYTISLVLALLLVMLIFPMTKIYRSWRGKTWLHQVRVMVTAWFIIGVILTVITFFTKTGEHFSREWMITWWLASITLILSYRYVLYRLIHVMREKGWNRKRIVIVGAGELGQHVLYNLTTSAWSAYDVVSFVDDDKSLLNKNINNVPVKCTTGELQWLIERENIDEIIITLPLAAIENIEKIQHALRHSTATIRFVPDIFSLRLVNHSIVNFAGLPVINLTETKIFGVYKLFKELEDKLLSLIIITLISPLLLLIAIGVKLSSKGPVFYKQERVSWNGKPFYMYKFRSMPIDAESKTGATWAKPNESRATKFGAFLRKTSLDELPQFFNVLMGHMSIVGPRPERPVFIDAFKDEIPQYMQKHLVKAGITGLAQINGWRGNTDLKKRIEFDMQYIENWSLMLDFKIIILTIFKGFVNKNAY